jgi:hypothetical protein
MIFFWILWIFDAIVALVVLYFFFIGLTDGSVSAFNGKLWTGILIGLIIIMLGSWFLRTDHLSISKGLLAILAIPSFFYGLFLLIAILTGAKWN